jgi:enoyl-CoA hydratase/carnithine racemase
MTNSHVLIERQGPVALVTLNDRATRNALSPPVVRELSAFFGAANADDTLGCIVLAAAGDGFCSGGNIKDMRDGTDPMFAGTPHQMQEAFRSAVQMIPKLLHELDVPLIAAVQGAAMGAGCDLACMCDIRIASTDAKFAESFLCVGLVSGDGGASSACRAQWKWR